MKLTRPGRALGRVACQSCPSSSPCNCGLGVRLVTGTSDFCMRKSLHHPSVTYQNLVRTFLTQSQVLDKDCALEFSPITAVFLRELCVLKGWGVRELQGLCQVYRILHFSVIPFSSVSVWLLDAPSSFSLLNLNFSM